MNAFFWTLSYSPVTWIRGGKERRERRRGEREGEERGKERKERRRGEREREERERRQVIKYTNTQRVDVTVSAQTIIKVSFQKICGAESLFMTNHYLNLGFQPNGKSSTSKVFSI